MNFWSLFWLTLSSYLVFRVYLSRSSRPEVFCKKVLLKISQNSQENTRVRVSFFLRPASLLKRGSGTGVFLGILGNFGWLPLFLTMPKKYCIWMNSNFTGNQSWNKSKHFHLFLILILKKSGFLILVMNNFYKAIFRSSCLQNVLQVLWKISQYSELKRDSNTGVFV